MKSNDYQLIKNELREYVSKVRTHTSKLRSDYIAEWALLTAIACWGAPEGFIRSISFLMAIILFSSKIYIPQRKRKLLRFIFMVKKRIVNAHLSDEQRMFIHKRVIKIEKITKNTNVVFFIRRCWKFILGYLFLMISSVLSIFLDFKW